MLDTKKPEPSHDVSRCNVRFPISVMILTFNEEMNIGSCLEHLDWADDLILIDSGSSDATVEIARKVRPDVRVFSNPFEDFGQQRNWALENCSPTHPWILFLDADEHCNDEFVQAVKGVVEDPQEHVGFYLTYRNYFLGRWIRYCTLYPSWQLRLLKLGEVRYRKEGHGQREVTDGPLGRISQPYDHYGFSKGVFDWIRRHNRYSSDEIELILRLKNEPLAFFDLFSSNPLARRKCLKRIAARVGFRPLFRFLYTYFFRFGFLDGRAGFMFCLLRVAHEMHITVKLAEAEVAQRGITSEKDRGDAVENQRSGG